ncbi:MAG: AMP-binding protein [Ornithinimicrobium sp.]
MDREHLGPDESLAWVAQTLAQDAPFVVPTSGSTGLPKSVVLSSNAVRSSADAVAARIGGHGQWLAALPISHVGGLGVFVRSVIAGTTPVVLSTGPFTVPAFAAAVRRLGTGRPRFVSLVPTQVGRLIGEPAGLAALCSFDRVLIGGASLSHATAVTLSEADIAWTHTYGLSETSGGCVYDGQPLEGVSLRVADAQPHSAEIDGAGRLMVAGPTLAEGYLDRPDLDAVAFEHRDGQRWCRTNDLGYWDPSLSRWIVVGRIDDVIVTGGHKVHPSAVQDAVRSLSGIAEAAVTGVPDPEWGTAVAALVVLSAGDGPMALRADPRAFIRGELRGRLPDHALPWRVKALNSLPRLPSGKVDYQGVRAAFTQEDDRI